jgi:flagellar M-ring protein FliF
MEFLEKDQALGTSRLIETARYHRALAGELSRSIATLDSVESARVHLAIPKRSVFVRNRSEPTASVLVNLYPGRALEDMQIAGIVHLVASSIPDLEAEQVTVVDQKGRLLTTNHVAGDITMRTAHFNYTRRLEESYVKRIVDILTPIAGAEGVRAQVSADVDLTSVEQTSEVYNPETTSVRSEQVEEQKSSESNPLGVPGALSNQPPEKGSFEEQSSGVEQGPPMSTNRRSTRNFEIDRTLSHSRTLPGSVKRLSVAVVVDYRLQANEKGVVERVPLQAEEMTYIKTLVKEAVGFDQQRGDSVNVINASFKEVSDAEPVSMPLWKEPWLIDILKQFLGVLFVLFLLFGVLRPVLKSLADKGNAPEVLALPAEEAQGELPMGEDRLSLTNQQGAPQQRRPLTPEQQMEVRLNQARSLVQDDPKRGAQVVKTWLVEDD